MKMKSKLFPLTDQPPEIHTDPPARDQLAVDIANAIRIHAPKLSTFEPISEWGLFDELASKVKGAWRLGTTHLSDSDWDEDDD